MAMPDAVTALLKLWHAPIENLQRPVYNITSFSLSAAEFRDLVLESFPHAKITFKPDVARQGIVDSWPANLSDSNARRDWMWEPAYGVERAFKEYLIPNIMRRYQK